MAKKSGKRNKQKKSAKCDDFIEIEQYGDDMDFLEYGPQYDTVNDCPIIPGETLTVKQTSFKKLGTDIRRILRLTMIEYVLAYWKENRQIPEEHTLKKFREYVIREVGLSAGVFSANCDDLKYHLNSCVVPLINKELQKEMANMSE